MSNFKLRKCIACNEHKTKDQLIKVVKNKSGEINIDTSGKLNGRGAYICDNLECLNGAIKTRALNRAFEMEIKNEQYEDLKNSISK